MLKLAKCHPNEVALAAVGSDVLVTARPRVRGLWRDPEVEHYEELADVTELEYLSFRYNLGKCL